MVCRLEFYRERKQCCFTYFEYDDQDEEKSRCVVGTLPEEILKKGFYSLIDYALEKSRFSERMDLEDSELIAILN